MELSQHRPTLLLVGTAAAAAAGRSMWRSSQDGGGSSSFRILLGEFGLDLGDSQILFEKVEENIGKVQTFSWPLKNWSFEPSCLQL